MVVLGRGSMLDGVIGGRRVVAVKQQGCVH